MESLQVFESQEFGKLNVMTVDGEPWFIGYEVAESLGYKQPKFAVRDNVDESDTNKLVIHLPKRRGNPARVVINESGLYSLIMRSNTKSARKFQRWVTSEVLPSIRKHGAYMTRDKVLESLRDPDSIAKLLETLKEEQEKNAQLTARYNTLDAENTVLAKKESTWKDVSVLNRLMRTYASKMGNNFQLAWNILYKKALYKYGINLKERRSLNGGQGSPMDYLHDGELDKLLALAAALCRERKIDVSECIGSENAKRIAS